MALAAWLSLIFLAVAIAGSTVLLVLRGLRTWRSFRAFTGAATAALDGVMQTAAAAETRAGALTANTERLSAATTHLQASLAQLQVLRDAADEARATVAKFGAFVPRK